MHIHTVFTDGELFPEEIVDYLADHKFRRITITDHDSIRGLDEARKKAHSIGVEFLTGVEITCHWREQGIGVHILGYGFDLDKFRNGVPGEYAREITAMWHRRGEKDIKKTQKSPIMIKRNGKETPFFVTREEILTESRDQSLMPGNIVIAAAKKFRRITGVNLGLFRLGRILYAQKESDKQFFEDYIKKHHPGLQVRFDERWRSPDNFELYMEVEDIVREIKAAGGLPVLAHPGELSFGQEAALSESDVVQFKKKGIEGLEVYAPKNVGFIEDLLTWCQRYGLIATGGSDWHGPGGFEDRKPGFYAPSKAIPDGCWDAVTHKTHL